MCAVPLCVQKNAAIYIYHYCITLWGAGNRLSFLWLTFQSKTSQMNGWSRENWISRNAGNALLISINRWEMFRARQARTALLQIFRTFWKLGFTTKTNNNPFFHLSIYSYCHFSTRNFSFGVYFRTMVREAWKKFVT